MNKKECVICRKIYRERQFWKARNNGTYDICKLCCRHFIQKSKDMIFLILKELDYPFFFSLWKGDIGKYIALIRAKKYKNYCWRDSNFFQGDSHYD